MTRSSRLAFTFFAATLCAFTIFQSCKTSDTIKSSWPAVSQETKPWSRWWWHGNALTKEGITAEMEAYQKAGLGGLEITPIYGVYGYEDKFVNFLTPEWMELLIHTLKEGDRLGLGIDMATGTGWPFGGPWIDAADACKNVQYKIYQLKEGESLKEKIEFIQQPFLRAVGNQIYEVHENAAEEGRVVLGTRKEPLMRSEKNALTIKDLVEPISANKNLQALALDQVQFEKPLSLQTLMAYSDAGERMDLITKVDANGILNWKAPKGNWKLYAVFQGWHGKMVERAGPGGEGNVIDHFSISALKRYLHHFDSAFKSHDIKSLRAFFNDSYEVDDARGAADWTPELFEEFRKRRGYDLRDHLPALFGQDNEEKNQRILCDYRQTIADLLLVNFTQPWKEWAHQNAAIVRNQAHGSPANILDLYATVDIPEIEGTDPLRIKMASSAGNVVGKKLISSESATWLNEHFESNLSDIKGALDRFMLNGVNHIFYHGTTYSPPGEAWPGRLFYAAVHLNPRNPLWNDFDALNAYVARCQSFLQNSSADNDVLLYYPIYDRFSASGEEMIEHFDGIGRQFEKTAFAYAADTMLKKGYAFDYISDKQIENMTFNDGRLKTEGNSQYKTIVIPHCRFMPMATLKKLASLAEQGAVVVMLQGYPETVSGYVDVERSKKEFETIVTKFRFSKSAEKGIRKTALSSGTVLEGDSIDVLLEHAGIRKETMVDSNINFIRKVSSDGAVFYLINNNKNEAFEGWLTLQTEAQSVVIYDPMTEVFGKGKTKPNNRVIDVYVQLQPKQSLILKTSSASAQEADYPYWKKADEGLPLAGSWKIKFTSGGPVLPADVTTESLTSWTAFEGENYASFSGTATYTLSFAKPALSAQAWLLDLGAVKESADVILNGKKIATLIGPTYQAYVAASLLQENNVLEISVSNLMANRIAHMDKNNIFWKKFYNVNFPARKSENRKNGLFSAAHWMPRESGLLGSVRLLPLKNL